MVLGDPWLAATWPFVRDQLPAPPARVLEIGCGRLGGFVHALIDIGHRAIGVDPQAPDEPEFDQTRFEEFTPAQPLHAVVACTSLHHVDDLDLVLDRLATVLAPGGTVVVIESAFECFDETTARWCFERLGPAASRNEANWLHGHRDGWVASGVDWSTYLANWVSEHALHPARAILDGLDRRFDRTHLRNVPYVFADLDHISEADEQAAIEAGQIAPLGRRDVGFKPATASCSPPSAL